MDGDYHLAFSCAPGVGPKRFINLIKKFGSAQKAFIATKQEYEEIGIKQKTFQKFDEFRNQFDIQKYKKRLENEDVEFISQMDTEYPQGLKQLDDPPIGLFTKGNISLLACHPELVSGSHEIPGQARNGMKALAVVGTRKTTSYGRQVTESLVSSLTSYGFTIVSGLALGIDAVAHKTTLENNGLTIAVLGCGVDCCYPRENQGLYINIIGKRGLIISEYPPTTPPTKGSFPARNRIIAALSQGILVTEAGADSGSLITADYGRKLEKKIFAVPGPITSRQSDGTSYLLKNGAKLVQNVKDIIDHLPFGFAQGRQTTDHLKKEKRKIDFDSLNLSKDEKAVLKCLEDESLQIDQLSKKLHIPIHQLSILVSSLEMQGLIKNNLSGEYEINIT